jgi:SH3-like domain-containing protein
LTSFIHLRSSAFICGFKKKEDMRKTHFVTKSPRFAPKNQKAINCKEKLPDIKKGVTFVYIRKKEPNQVKAEVSSKL